MDNPTDLFISFSVNSDAENGSAISVGFFHLVLAGVDLNLQGHSILKRVCILDFLKEISRNLELLSFQKLNGL